MMSDMQQNIRVYEKMNIPFHTILNAGVSSPAHCHPFYEVFVVNQGSIDHIVNGHKERLGIGDMFLIYPGAVHEFIACGESVHRDYLINNDVFEKAKMAIEPFFFDEMQKQGYIKAHLSLTEVLYLEESTTSFLALTDVEKRRVTENIIAMRLLSLLYSETPQKVQTTPFEQITIDAIAKYFNKPDAYEKIREEVGYNEKYFCQKFKACFGMGLVAYITKKRMDYANYLLRSTSMTIESVVNEIGIESVSHFHKLYTKEFHMTPGKTRKEGKI